MRYSTALPAWNQSRRGRCGRLCPRPGSRGAGCGCVEAGNMRKKVGILPLLFLAGTLGAEVVSESGDALFFRQPDGVTVRLRKHPKRTVIAFGSLAQVWYLAGGEAAAVPQVRSRETLPPAARELPEIGRTHSPNAERIVALEPDLLLLGRFEKHRALAETARRAGIDAVCLDYANYRDFLELLELFRRLNGRGPGELPEAQNIVSEVEEICRNAAKHPPVRFAAMLATAGGFSLERDGMNISTIATMLGGRNVVASPGADRITFSYEQLLLDDPEVIFVVAMGDDAALRGKFRNEIMSQPAWQTLQASKNGRVHFLDAGLFLFQPGSRFPEAFRQLDGLLHPPEQEPEREEEK